MSEDKPNQPKPEPEAGRTFRLPIFEGPLDLLLHLIKRNELDPQEVTASVITEQYLEYLELMESLNLDVAGEYLVMAATLLLIKSFSLLPHPGVADEEESDSLKRDLVERLLEYQRYREAAFKLGERSLLGRDVFARAGEKPIEEPSTLSYKVSLFELVEALRAVLKRLGGDTTREIHLREIRVAECIPMILGTLESGERVGFFELFADLADVPLVVATFLALLELIRRGQVRVWQERGFGQIFIQRTQAEESPQEP